MTSAVRSSLSSTKTGRSQSSRARKRVSEDPPDLAFSKRFSTILFSLYNPHISPEFDRLPSQPESSTKSKGLDKAPSFDSPLCTFRVKSDLQESEARQDEIIQAFDQRSKALLSELKKKEYDIEVSMVPYDFERSGGDRMSRKSGTTTLDSPSASGRRSVGKDGRSSPRGSTS
jgi:hypothetical protein